MLVLVERKWSQLASRGSSKHPKQDWKILNIKLGLSLLLHPLVYSSELSDLLRNKHSQVALDHCLLITHLCLKSELLGKYGGESIASIGEQLM